MKKYYYEFVTSWEIDEDIQYAYAYVFADTVNEGRQTIKKAFPDIEVLNYARTDSKDYSDTFKEYYEGIVKLWFVDRNKIEHHITREVI